MAGEITVDLSRNNIVPAPQGLHLREKDRIIMVKAVEEFSQVGSMGRFKEMCNVLM